MVWKKKKGNAQFEPEPRNDVWIKVHPATPAI